MGASLVLPGMVFIGVFAVATAVLMVWSRASAAPHRPSPVSVATPAERAVTIVPPPTPRDEHFRDCRDARAARRYSIPAWDPSYREEMDRDGDGFACEPLPGPGQRGRPAGRVRVLH